MKGLYNGSHDDRLDAFRKVDMSDQQSEPKGPDLRAGVPLDDLQDECPLLGHVDGDGVILVRRGAEVFAIGAVCSHYGGPLAEGLVVGDTVRCPWHHACFSLRTGEALKAPALNPVSGFTVSTREESVFVSARQKKPGTVRPRAQAASAPRSVGIVGAGAAGNCVAEELRHLGFQGEITLVDGDRQAPYDRPNLSKDYLAGSAPEEWIPLHPRSYYDEHAIELARGRRVAGLDPVRRSLTFDDGSAREFGAIILATGAEPVRLPIPGEGGPPVFYLRTLDDSRAIIAATKAARRGVVLGASFIGLEVAASLRARKVDVHVVAPDARPLERVLGAEVGDFVRRLHEEHGVVFHLGQTASGVESGRVVLSSGERLAADLIVAGVGVRPAVALAEAAGLRVDNGIVVDARLQTEAPGVFAVGDCARWPDPRSGGLVRIEHWVLAERQGQAVARTLAGLGGPFVDVPFFWSQHYDVSLNYVGHAPRWDQVVVEGSLENRDATIRYRSGRKLLALASIRRERESLEAELAMEEQVRTTASS
jgi:NADPH-dependent 2,4-dienoyl-CoA reductase/sulfur reductase-like enzyme/nitrite reductase/ring-hydroxylating ferredoxin subunit